MQKLLPISSAGSYEFIEAATTASFAFRFNRTSFNYAELVLMLITNYDTISFTVSLTSRVYAYPNPVLWFVERRSVRSLVLALRSPSALARLHLVSSKSPRSR